jgi:CSLREA domain-containing protein
MFESLEERRKFATITVTTAADSIVPNDGGVSLREAITAMNAGNAKKESDESLSVLLSNPINASITDAIGIGTIRNDD